MPQSVIAADCCCVLEVATVPKRDAVTLYHITKTDEYEMLNGNNMTIRHRTRACRCCQCLVHEYESCERKSHVPEWVEHVLKPATPTTQYRTRQRHEETLETLAHTIKAGDVVALEHTDVEYQHYDYYLLKATKAAYKARVVTVNLVVGSVIVAGGGAHHRRLG